MTAETKNECAVGVFPSVDPAQQAVHALVEEGVPSDCISLITADHTADIEKHLGERVDDRVEDPEDREAMQLGDDTAKDVAAGAGMGGVLGLLAGGAAFAISGIGIIFVAGPIAAGITGGIVGAYLTAMRGWGVHEDHVAAYEEQVKAGKTLVICTGDPLVVARSVRVLREQSADSVDLHAATESDAPDVRQSASE